MPTTSVLRGHVATLEASTTARAEAAEGATIRRFKEFYDGAGSWSRVERIPRRHRQRAKTHALLRQNGADNGKWSGHTRPDA